VTIGRELAATDPDTYRPGLAATVDNLSVTLTELRRPAKALTTVRQAVALYRELDNQDGYRLDLCCSLGNLAQAMKKLGQHEDAAAVQLETRKLTRDMPS
jgi:Tetratricopeptide repeat